jgi:26S proteasome regulatory subunit T5
VALEAQIAELNTEQIQGRIRMFDNNIRVMKSESARLQHELTAKQAMIKDNNEKIKMNKQLPYLVASVVEVLQLEPEADDDGAALDLDAKQTKCVVVKTTTRQTVFLPVVGLVDPETLKPGDLVGVNKDSYLILDPLPAEYDSRVKGQQRKEQ